MTLEYGTKVKSKIAWDVDEEPPTTVGTVVEPESPGEAIGHSVIGVNIVELDGKRWALFDDEAEVVD